MKVDKKPRILRGLCIDTCPEALEIDDHDKAQSKEAAEQCLVDAIRIEK